MKTKPIALDMPEDEAELAGWLERLVVGERLGALVAELEGIHGPAPRTASLDQALGDRRKAVLRDGLASLPHDRFGLLLRQPRLLLKLQELVLVSGGPYWETLAAAQPDHRDALSRGRVRLPGLPNVPGQALAARGATPLAEAPRRWRSLRWGVGLAATAAAALLLGAFLIPGRPGGRRQSIPPPATASGWGWNRPGALAEDLPPAAYLDHLADSAQEWFNQRPDEPLELARRITEFRQGCSVLILSDHKPLTADDRAWLVERCRAWVAKLDAHLAFLESGQPAATIRDQADATIHALIAALRERAKPMS
jgi:hypothetical protein